MPGLLKRFLLRVRATMLPRHDRELQAELDLHLRLMEEEYIAQGVAPDQARRLARREFGNPALIQETSHDLFSFRALENLVRDLRYAGRDMRRSPSFTVIAVASLAIGIGAATATFAVIDAVMLRSLPVRSPERLIAFSTASDKAWGTWSYAAFARWRKALEGVSEVAASSHVRPFAMPAHTTGPPEEVRVGLVSDNYFQVLGAGVVLGRPFTASDTSTPGSGAVAIVSDGFWRRRLGGTSDVLTRTIALAGIQHAVIGVAAPGFTGHSVGYPSDVWVPLTMQPALLPGMKGLDENAGPETRWLQIVGRLTDAAGIESAAAPAALARQVFLTEKAARLGSGNPEVARDRAERVRLLPAAKGDAPVRARFARPLAILGGITALVLLVACTNFTNLMFARAEGRRQEFLIRLALGGGRWRLLRESAAECVALAAIAAALSLLFASWATAAAMSLVAAVEPVDFAIGLNARVLAFAAGCATVAAAAGLWPCGRLIRHAVLSSVHHGAGRRGAGARPLGHRVLLIAQLAVCAVMLIGAGLLLRTVINLRGQDLGYDRKVVLIPIAAERPGRSPEAAATLVREMRDRVATIPGVEAVGIFGSALLDNRSYWVDGSERLTTDRGTAPPGTRWTFAAVGPGFFEAVGMRVVRGRALQNPEMAAPAGEVVINQSLATALFGSGDAINRRLALNPRGPMQTIVGVMQDARQVSPRDRGLGVVYMPIRGYAHVILAVRVADPSSEAAALVRQQAEPIVGAHQAGRITTISEELDRAIGRERLMSGISLFLAVLVVAIGCVGVYALVSYDVARRKRELGIRLALGATGRQLVAMVLGDGAAMLVPALAIGLPAGLAASRLLSSQLYGVAADDPGTLMAAGMILSIVAMAAVLRPAQAVLRIDPTVLLRHD